MREAGHAQRPSRPPPLPPPPCPVPQPPTPADGGRSALPAARHLLGLRHLAAAATGGAAAHALRNAKRGDGGGRMRRSNGLVPPLALPRNRPEEQGRTWAGKNRVSGLCAQWRVRAGCELLTNGTITLSRTATSGSDCLELNAASARGSQGPPGNICIHTQICTHTTEVAKVGQGVKTRAILLGDGSASYTFTLTLLMLILHVNAVQEITRVTCTRSVDTSTVLHCY